jgi:hypothetical protein
MGNAAGVVGAALVAAERGVTAPARDARPARVTAIGG